ncbi:hypothetical protein BDE02_10G040600 [Populus trichocarpa]|nr:hypothetical protein BDE02_10G040600 [Populus trichocarpa]
MWGCPFLGINSFYFLSNGAQILIIVLQSLHSGPVHGTNVCSSRLLARAFDLLFMFSPLCELVILGVQDTRIESSSKTKHA